MIKNTKEYITCIYGTCSTSYIAIFDPEDNYELYSMKIVNLGGQFFKSVVLPDEREKILFCSLKSDEWGYLNCLNYDISSNTTSEDVQTIYHTCGHQPINLIMEYFYETEKFIVGCKENGNVVYLNEFSQDMIKSESDYIYSTSFFPSNSGNIGRMNIVIPQGGNQYNIYFNPNPECHYDCHLSENKISGIGSELSNIHSFPTTEILTVICTGDLYYNYNHTACIDTIPPGFYCNSTTDRTIDSCHQNCQTCNKGPTNNNNNHNCLTCSTSGTFYFDLGNCVTVCTYGHFTYNDIEICKCSTDTSCEYCSEESKRQNLCETCNTNYYPKKDDTNNNGTLIKCYNSDSISNGYYLNTATSQYEPCHSNCLKCSGAPTDSNDNCITCIEGFSLIINRQDIENCYPYCNNFYYFDEDNDYHCNSNCPDGYKLINDKRKCIDECSNDNIFNYKYEYKNICYQSCPTDTTNSSSHPYKCELNCKHFNKYFNEEGTACISTIPEGYYCNNNETNTISRCHSNCKTCIIGPSDDNNNCETCKDEGTIYFDLGNCRENCINGNFTENSINKCKCSSHEKCHYCTKESSDLGLCVNCSEGYYPKLDDTSNQYSYINCYNNDTIEKNYFLNNENKYEACHSNCETCDERGSNEENKCTKCKSGFIFIKNNLNITNCYEDCNKYYFDSDNIYHCVDSCPGEYKLINGTNKCIDNCNHDYIYNSKYEYETKCYTGGCPSGSNPSNDNPFYCEPELYCEFYYNFEHNDCLTDIPNGYYPLEDTPKTIGKCHDNCLTCNIGPTTNNHNCEICKENKYYELGNCRDECIHGNYTDDNLVLKCKCTSDIKCKECTEQGLCKSCNNDEGYYPKIEEERNSEGIINCYLNPSGYFLTTIDGEKYYKKCYETCSSCEELGDETNNKCTACILNYDFKDDYEDENCYIN